MFVPLLQRREEGDEGLLLFDGQTFSEIMADVFMHRRDIFRVHRSAIAISIEDGVELFVTGWNRNGSASSWHLTLGDQTAKSDHRIVGFSCELRLELRSQFLAEVFAAFGL